jgi:hypothetical protein
MSCLRNVTASYKYTTHLRIQYSWAVDLQPLVPWCVQIDVTSEFKIPVKVV